MLFTLAWRNIWRNRLRSFVIFGAIIIGVWAAVFLLSFMVGMVRTYIASTIQNEISHLQVHQEKFKADNEVQYFFTGVEQKLKDIRTNNNVLATTARTAANGIISSPKSSRGVFIRGIVPNDEAAVTRLNTKVIEGEYLSEKKRNPILISQKLAEKLDVKLRKKVVLRFQDMEGEIIDGAFRIVGIYKTDKALFDNSHVFVRQRDLNQLLGIESGAHEIAVYLKNEDELLKDYALVQEATPGLLVETYEQLSPDVKLFKTQISVSSVLIIGIIMLALVFGIINTMLMAVLERYRELGMLMSVGMNKVRVFGMIMLETILLGVVSAPIGMLLGFITVSYFHHNGIDLSAYADGMNEFGMAAIVYPDLESRLYFELAFAVLLTSFIGALYPAFKAIRLNPVEAIRKI